jgi:hypothetical protein
MVRKTGPSGAWKRPGARTPGSVFRERKTMSTNATDANESTDPTTEYDERTVRALTEYISVLPEAPDVGIYTVVGQHENGAYTVDVEAGRCTCPDAEYNLTADERCKHERRVRFATGIDAVPTDVDHDPSLGEHVDGGPILAASDGGTTAESAETATETDAAPTYTYHREPAHVGGKRYVRCEECGAESVPADPDRVLHAPECSESTRRGE